MDRMEVEQGDGEGQRARLEDLEQEKAALLEQNKDLQERNRELQVHVCQLLSELLHKKECCHHNYGVTSTNMYVHVLHMYLLHLSLHPSNSLSSNQGYVF